MEHFKGNDCWASVLCDWVRSRLSRTFHISVPATEPNKALIFFLSFMYKGKHPRIPGNWIPLMLKIDGDTQGWKQGMLSLQYLMKVNQSICNSQEAFYKLLWQDNSGDAFTGLCFWPYWTITVQHCPWGQTTQWVVWRLYLEVYYLFTLLLTLILIIG